MKKTLLAIIAIAALTFVACNDPVKKADNKEEQTTEQPANGTQNVQEQQSGDTNAGTDANAPASATNAKPATSKHAELPTPSEAEIKKIGLTGDLDNDVAVVVKAIVKGANALREGKDPKEVDKATQKLLETAAGYYKSKGKLDEFNEKRDEVMKEELTKELAKQKK